MECFDMETIFNVRIEKGIDKNSFSAHISKLMFSCHLVDTLTRVAICIELLSENFRLIFNLPYIKHQTKQKLQMYIQRQKS